MNTLAHAIKLCPEWIAILEEGTQIGALKLSITLLLERPKEDDNPLMDDLLRSWLLILERRKIKALISLLKDFLHRH